MTQELNLGKIITTPQKRDAIHIAVVPVIAAHSLSPGDKVALVPGTTDRVQTSYASSAIGVVDPFLAQMVERGQQVWLYLNPGSITSLRHDWTHPAFESVEEVEETKPDRAASEKWLLDFCNSSDCPGFDAVMQAIQGNFENESPEYYSSGGYIDSEYLHFSGRDAHGELPPAFWTHAEIYLGMKLQCKPPYFSCSC